MPSRNSPLAESSSPFLRHGAEQPVAWLPWGDAAFRRARAEDRPILLDIGAVWCHWCHVMDRESYEDPETADLINELFVPIKVDRDERPDVDARYQRAVQSVVGVGGWPLTAFLTPRGEVFHGGTYFPPEAAHGRPSFRAVLREVARVWAEERPRVRSLAETIASRLQVVLTGEAERGGLEARLIAGAVDALSESYDPRHGGFGRAPKFPNAGALALLLDEWLDQRSSPARDMVRGTLAAMVAGGIHDHLGGGFHRYSTDARWIIPHFEKMAYDNGPLLGLLARAGNTLGEPRFLEAASGIISYYRDIAPDLVEAGGFPASQDADIGPDDDGDHWTWTEAEIRSVLKDRNVAEAALRHWGVGDAAGAMHLDPKRHVLFEAESVAEVASALDASEGRVAADLKRATSVLKAARDRRPRPFVDTSLYSGWVALVAAGHLAAARFAGADGAGDDAVRALKRLWQQGWREDRGMIHRLDHRGGVEQLPDQAYFAAAAVDAFEWTQDPLWLDRARAVTAVIRNRFAHVSGGLTDRPSDSVAEVPVLGADRLEITDAPEPSPTAVAAMTMARIAALDHDSELRGAASDLLRTYAGAAPRFAANAASYFRAVRWVVRPVTSVVVVEDTGDNEGLLAAALRRYRPGTVVRRYAPGQVDPDRMHAAIVGMLDGSAPRAYVCEGSVCAPPVESADDLTALLDEWPG